MSEIIVATSTVEDGSMYDRNDDADPTVLANRERFLTAHSIQVDQTTRLGVNTVERDKVLHETDWCKYVEVTEQDSGRGMHGDKGLPCDALVTRDPNRALALAVADCIGTAIYDPTQSVLMVTHLGRQSLEQDGGKKSVEYLVEKYQSNPADLKVWMTAAAGKEKYPMWAFDNRSMKDVVFEQLAAAGILLANITDNPAETTEDLNYFSYSEWHHGRRENDGDHWIVAMMTD